MPSKLNSLTCLPSYMQDWIAWLQPPAKPGIPVSDFDDDALVLILACKPSAEGFTVTILEVLLHTLHLEAFSAAIAV